MNDLITLDEIQANITAINNASADIGKRLLELRQCEAWRVLGYSSWTAFLGSGLFTHSRKHLYELMKAAPVKEKLVTLGYKVNEKIAVALAPYDDSLYPAIMEMSLERYEKPTAAEITGVAEFFQEVVRTGGYVDIGDGKSTPVDANLTMQEIEVVKRQKQYIAESVQKKNVVQAPLTDFEIHLVIEAVTSRAADQDVARVARTLIRTIERKAVS